jgi:hypothetical protein
MNRREKILAAVVIALVAAWLGRAWYGDYRDALSARRTAVNEAKARLSELNRALAAGRRALQQLETWQERSLPDNHERALSLYKAWMLATAKDAGLTVSDIKPAARTSAPAAYNTIGYQIEATGSLSAVTSMLYEFYRSPLMHQITRLRLHRPAGDSSLLQVTLEVEALRLPGAVATDSLPQGSPQRVRLASLDAYQKSLVERDPLTPYTPHGAATASSTADADDSQHAYFSSTVGGGREAWINVRSTGETLHLAAGDPLKIGKLEGHIISIEPRALIFKSGEKTFRVALGQSLRSGKEIVDDAPPERSES